MYHKRGLGWTRHIDFLIQELICFQAAFCTAYIIKNGFLNPYALLLYRNASLVAMLIQVFIIISLNIYKDVLWRGYYNEIINTTKTVGMVMFMLVFYLFLIKQGIIFSRVILIGTMGYYWIFACLMRCLRKFYLRSTNKNKRKEKSLIIMTTKQTASKALHQIQNRNLGEFLLKGIVYLDCEKPLEKELEGIPIIAGSAGAIEYICRDWVDEVFLSVPYMDELYREIINTIADMNMVVHMCIGSEEDFPLKKKTVEQFGEFMVITMSSSILNTREAFAKRLMDILGGAIGCIITGIVTLIIGPAIYIKSPGPIFFSQMRVGRNGKIFRMYKFRSMYPDAESRKKDLEALNEVQDGFMFKIENDPRIIGSEKGAGKGIGNFIRKTSLDEFPQFFNVLKGDMSLVGTRPPTLDEWEKYEPHHRGRMSVRPGITGMWQVSGRSDIMDFEEVVSLDRKYIAEWSVGLDIKILLKTVVMVLKGVGAK